LASSDKNGKIISISALLDVTLSYLLTRSWIFGSTWFENNREGNPYKGIPYTGLSCWRDL